MDSTKEPRRFILEKRPNILCCVLIVPLVPKDASNEEAQAIASKLGDSARRISPLPRITHQPSLVAPSMTAEKLPNRTSIVTVFAPLRSDPQASEYLKVHVDCLVDIERSTLTVHGDHLAGRLAFTEFSAARDARIASELQSCAYKEEGIRCRSCGNQIVVPDMIQNIHRAPRLPWGELLESMTCVNPVEYRSSQTADAAFSLSQTRVTPSKQTVLVSETYLAVNGKILSFGTLEFHPYEGHEQPLLLNESEEHARSRNWHIANCSSCRNWLGDVRTDDEDEVFAEARFFKAAVQVGALLDQYKLESILCGAALDAATTRECYRFVLAYSDAGIYRPLMRLVLLSYDTWISTEVRRELHPVMKFLYWSVLSEKENEVELWAKRTGAEWIGLPSQSAATTIATSLQHSTERFPHSLRHLPDGSSLGFLYW